MLRYPGGKTRAINDLEYVLNEEKISFTGTKIFSPFYGGGSFEKYLHDKYNCTIIGNDLFKPLFLFWKALKTQTKDLHKYVKLLHPMNKEQFTKTQNEFQSYKDDIKIASAYFALNRSSFSGTTTSGGFSKQASDKRFTPSSINRINNYDMTRISIYNLDFEDFIHQHRKNNEGILFLDPPYKVASNLYGTKGDLHKSFNHDRLADVLENQNNWILTYNNDKTLTQRYRKIKGVVIYDAYWSYGMNKSKKSSEIIILRFLKDFRQHT